MKRILLGLAMVSSLALIAAQANAAALGECGKSYAFQVHGTEPELTNDQPLNYIVGIGQITFGAAGTAGTTGCVVTHLEMEYNDNAINTLNAGPAQCDAADSFTGGGVPCFDGANHQNVTGTLTPSPFGNGGQRLTIDPSFGWANGNAAATDLPFAFTLQANLGDAIILGNSVPDPGPNPTSPPPGSPVIVITMQKQSTTLTLPVTGPLGGSNGYGVAPYVGLSVSLFEGFGAHATDPFNLPGITGSFGSTISALQIFTNGEAGGSTSFSTNDNVGNTTGVSENDCDTELTQESNFGDATSNNKASIINPGNPNCGDADAGAAFTIDTVQFGATDTSDYAIVSGLAAAPAFPAGTGGLLIPSGDISTALGLPSSPAGTLSTLAVPTAFTAPDTGNAGGLGIGYIKFTNTTPAGCDTTASITGTATDGICTLSVTPGPVITTGVVEGDTPSTQYYVTKCTCTGEDAAGLSGANLVIQSTNCPITGGTGTPSTVTKALTCNN